MELTDKTIKVLNLSTDDFIERLKSSGDDLKYQIYWDYRDEIDEKTFIDCFFGWQYEKSYYELRDKEGYTPQQLHDEILNRLENLIWDWNIDSIYDEIYARSREIVLDSVKKECKEKGISYNEINYDDVDWCEIQWLWDIDLDMSYILKRSYVHWNLEWFSNYDGIFEWEKYEDGQCIKDLIDNFPRMKEYQWVLEKNACEIYSGSSLKFPRKMNMWDFLEVIENGWFEASGTAVLHQDFNGSGSPDFEITWWFVEFGKTPEWLAKGIDCWDIALDKRSNYGVCSTYWEDEFNSY